MERLKSMKETLMCCVQGQMGHLDTVDTKELGEAVDMIKDLSEAIYYCTITDAMEGKEHKRDKEYHYYTERYMPQDYRMMDKGNGRIYYDGMGHEVSVKENAEHHGEWHEKEMPFQMRDEREGRSHMSRKNYMESKEMHHDKNVKLKDLEKYMQELTSDMVEMIEGASPEEKQLLEKRISALATKIGQMNV